VALEAILGGCQFFLDEDDLHYMIVGPIYQGLMIALKFWIYLIKESLKMKGDYIVNIGSTRSRP